MVEPYDIKEWGLVKIIRYYESGLIQIETHRGRWVRFLPPIIPYHRRRK
jgi:hypothetical protein